MFVTRELTVVHKWVISFIISFVAVILFYNPESLQWNMFWAFTFLAIALFAFEPIPSSISATLLMLGFVAFSIAPPEVAFNAWLGFLPWIIFASLCIDAIVEKSGLAHRVALHVMNKIAKTPFMLFMAFLIAGYLMNFIIADVFPNVIVLGTFGLGICRALDLKADSKAATCIMVAAYVAASNAGANFLPNNLGLVAVQMLGEYGFTTNWIEFFVNNISLAFLSTLCSLLILYFYSRNEIASKMADVRECIQKECEELEPITLKEIKAFSLLLIAVTALISEPIHGLHGVFLKIFVLFLSFCPPFNLLTKEDMEKFNFGIIFFVAGCLSIGFTGAYLGVPVWVTQKLMPIIEHVHSAASMNTLAYFIGVLGNFVLTPLGTASSLSAPIADIAVQLGLSAKPAIYSLLLGLDQWVLPYESAPALFLYASGYMRLKHIFVITSIRIFVLAAVVWFNTVTVWNFMGI